GTTPLNYCGRARINLRAPLAIRGERDYRVSDACARTTRRCLLGRRRRAAFERPEDGSILQGINSRTGNEFLLRAQAVYPSLLIRAQYFGREVGKISEQPHQVNTGNK